uniref:protein tweety homolog 2-like isoform X2 n=1 Tax=Myxine glutinosa TaxID=7769 RepID=UPI00358E3184
MVAWLPPLGLPFPTGVQYFPPLGSRLPAVFADLVSQSLLFLAGAVGVGLTLNLACLSLHFLCRCCRRSVSRAEPHHKGAHPRCATTWLLVAALICSVAVGMGFYGSGETEDGLQRASEGLIGADTTIRDIRYLVDGTLASLTQRLNTGLKNLELKFVKHAKFTPIVQQATRHLADLQGQLQGLPFLQGNGRDVEDSPLPEIQQKLSSAEFYRWLGYLLLLTANLLLCLLLCLAVARGSSCLLNLSIFLVVLMLFLDWTALAFQVSASVGGGDLCFVSDEFVLNMSRNYHLLSGEELEYYIHCDYQSSSPFQQKVTASVRDVSDLQSKIAELMLFNMPNIRLELQLLQTEVNHTEVAVQQLAALLHCRALNKDYREVLLGLCQDGLLGFLWVSGFSIIAICCFTLITCLLPSTCQHLRTRDNSIDEDEQEDDPFSPRSYRHGTAGHLGRLHFASLYSYGSETSLPPLAHAAPTTAVPPSQHTNQTGPFTTNPIYEDAPLLRQQSPPPSYATAMRHHVSCNSNECAASPQLHDGVA